ncbi:hypothetical protein [Rubripirellula obstinata]|nr:hypothetical protein [Rubripirellula obstinata]
MTFLSVPGDPGRYPTEINTLCRRFPLAQALSELTGIAFMAAMAWGIARGLHLVVARSGERKRIHGQYIPEWVAGTVVLFGVAALVYFGPVPNVPSPPSTGCAAFGILGGLMAGTIHGWFRLARYPNLNAVDSGGLSRETGNPYQPPSSGPQNGG